MIHRIFQNFTNSYANFFRYNINIGRAMITFFTFINNNNNNCIEKYVVVYLVQEDLIMSFENSYPDRLLVFIFVKGSHIIMPKPSSSSSGF